MFEKIIVWYKMGLMFLTGVSCLATGYLWGIVIGVITLILSAIQMIGYISFKTECIDEDKVVNAIYDEDSTFEDIF